jgi:hypothetical protein
MNGHIQHGEGAQSVGPEEVLGDAGIDEQLVPAVRGRPEVPVPDARERGCVPSPGQGAEFSELGRRRLGIRRRCKAEFLARGKHPCLPCAGAWLDRARGHLR